MSDNKSKSRQKKETIVGELSEKLERAKALIFTNYQGLTHKQIEKLKKSAKALNADYVVVKNTLLLKSLEGSKIKLEEKDLEGPTAAMFVYGDVIEPLKNLGKTIRQLGLPTIKFGILDEKLVKADQLLRLATLPSREVLIAQFVNGLKFPIYGLHRALSWNLQKLLMTLKAIETGKAGENK